MLQLDRKTILEAIRQLPPEEQQELAREIVQIADIPPRNAVPERREPPAAPDRRLVSAMSLRGIVKTEEPLDDERLLDESRMERYGA